jgi:HPr kinase/phosphorylase
MKKHISVLDIIKQQGSMLKLKKVICNDFSIKNKIISSDINRPGLAFAGYYEYFAHKRIQVIGNTELNYLKKIGQKELEERIKKFISYKIPCVVFTRNNKIPKIFLTTAEKNNIVILKTSLTTTRVIGALTMFLEDSFAPFINIHGSLLDVHGVGVLLLGGSGVGKSECALELIEKGHRLVADDLVNLTCKLGRFLMGSGAGFIRHHMEIRGLGIIDIKSIYGVTALRSQKRVGLVISLEEWDSKKEYERLGLEEKIHTILGVDLPHFIIPVKPGRNLGVLIEVAATSQRLKRMGINPAEEIEKKMLKFMEKGINPLNINEF